VTLHQARESAAKARTALAEGIDPKIKRLARAVPNFGEIADRLVEDLSTSWRNEKHRAQWRMTLEVYAAPLRSLRVDQIEVEHVLEVLKPIWSSKPETASRLRGRVEKVLDAAKARGHRTGENPARWRGHLDHLLPPRQRLTRGHHAAMPYLEVPRFVTELRRREAVAACALEFLILTATRSGEVIGARWQECDLEKGVWTIPAARMKAGRQHRVPLTARAIEILKLMRSIRVGEYVFPSREPTKPLSSMVLEMLLRRMGQDAITVHGFRSSFRDWAGETTSFPRETAEAALAHTVGDQTERAYRRGDALEKRRKLMEHWASFLRLGKEGNTST
jgi:integrase